MDIPAAGERAPAPVRAAFVLAVAVLAALTIVGADNVGSPSSGLLLAVDIAVGVLGSAAILPLARRDPPLWVAFGLAVLAGIAASATPAATAGTLRIARTRPLPTAAAVAASGAAA